MHVSKIITLINNRVSTASKACCTFSLQALYWSSKYRCRYQCLDLIWHENPSKFLLKRTPVKHTYLLRRNYGCNWLVFCCCCVPPGLSLLWLLLISRASVYIAAAAIIVGWALPWKPNLAWVESCYVLTSTKRMRKHSVPLAQAFTLRFTVTYCKYCAFCT